MTLNNWLTYLESRLGSCIKLGLERIREVANKLDLLSFSCPVITIAGTNGKGSCVAYLENILGKAGYKVGAYTSPHLLRFNERIHINGKEIDDDSLCNAFAIIEKACGDVELTYFEFTTLAALYIFQHNSLDVLLLEIGLGGRLDAVNIIDSDIAVITTIAIDHIAYLGNTREAIGYEKAGIMREGKPVVCGDPDPPQSLIQQANLLHAPLYIVDSRLRGNDEDWRGNDPLPNSETALMVIKLLQQKLPVSEEIINMGLKTAFLPGRFQIIDNGQTILDVAHNPAAGDFLAKQLAKHQCKRRTHAVVSMLKDKDIIGTLRPMLHLIDKWYLADLHVSSGARAEDLGHALKDLGRKSWYSFTSVLDAYVKAVANCAQNDKIVIFGSFYTVAEILKRRS
jgi:dihydrofolate synthase/folylpolyglutamate synthase